jgi:hypothetical protein
LAVSGHNRKTADGEDQERPCQTRSELVRARLCTGLV